MITSPRAVRSLLVGAPSPRWLSSKPQTGTGSAHCRFYSTDSILNKFGGNNDKFSLLGAASVLGISSLLYLTTKNDEEETDSDSVDVSMQIPVDTAAVVAALRDVCSTVETRESRQTPYTKGQRIGAGKALAVCKPKTFAEAVNALQAAVSGGCAIIVQGGNTGLTGGSVPRDEAGREFVVINMSGISKATTLVSKSDGDVKVVCTSGFGIFSLSKLCKAIGRESHSVLGSLFLNPSVGAGIAYGSGGTQCRKGPAYTERCLFAKVQADGKVVVVDETGIKADSLEELYNKIESGNLTYEDLDHSGRAKYWLDSYPRHVTKLDGAPARFNADVSSPSDACRTEGKVMLLASVNQTFASPKSRRTFWCSPASYNMAQKFREEVVLADKSGETLPASCEYMNKETWNITMSGGRILCSVIGMCGMEPLAAMFRFKDMCDRYLPNRLSDALLMATSQLIPKRTVMPKQVLKNHANADHHLLVDVCEYGGGEEAAIMNRINKFVQKHGKESIQITEIDQKDAPKVNVFRFTNAAAFGVYCKVMGWTPLSLDYAMPKKSCEIAKLPPGVTVGPRMIYGHFGCAVFHDDIALQKSTCPHEFKMAVKELVKGQGGMLPAEHGHGMEYQGTPEMIKRLQNVDPLNCMNPGAAGMSVLPFYGNAAKTAQFVQLMKNRSY